MVDSHLYTSRWSTNNSNDENKKGDGVWVEQEWYLNSRSDLKSSVIKTRVKAATLLRHASVSSEEAMKRTIDAKVIDIIAEKLGANVNSQNASSSSLTDLAQEREAYIRLLLDVAQRVDFMKNEDAVNQFRSERFVQTVQNCQTFVDASKKNRDKMIDEEEFIVAVDRLRNMLK